MKLDEIKARIHGRNWIFIMRDLFGKWNHTAGQQA